MPRQGSTADVKDGRKLIENRHVDSKELREKRIEEDNEIFWFVNFCTKGNICLSILVGQVITKATT